MSAIEKAREESDLILNKVPVIAASKPHIWFLVLLWFPLVPMSLIWPSLVPVTVQLALGNHTNIISAAAASIAAGVAAAGTMHAKKAADNTAEQLELTRQNHALLHTVHADAAAELGQVPGVADPQ